jgi:uncharacterized membrane protein YsdA (DUF1294 family)
MNPYIFFGAAVAALGTFAAWLASHYAGGTPLVSAFVGINVTAVLGMGFDKGFARSGALRIPEVVFFILALLGGSPGIILGSHLFKHKYRKPYFQFVMLLIIALQVLVCRLLGIPPCAG